MGIPNYGLGGGMPPAPSGFEWVHHPHEFEPQLRPNRKYREEMKHRERLLEARERACAQREAREIQAGFVAAGGGWSEPKPEPKQDSKILLLEE